MPILSVNESRTRQRDQQRARQKRRQQVWDKTYGHCAYCGCALAFRAFHMDHRIPRKDGGANDLENLMPSCRDCNESKGTLALEDWRIVFTYSWLEQLYAKDPRACAYWKLQPFWYEVHATVA